MQKKPSQRKPSAGKKSVPERTGKRPTLVDASSFNLTEDEAALLALNEITISRYSLNFCLNDEIHDEMENTFRTTMCNMQRGLLKYLNTLLIVLLPFLTFAEFCFQFATENRWTPTVVNRLTISYTGNEEIFWFIIFLRSAICLFLVWVKMIKFFDSDAYYHRQKLMMVALGVIQFCEFLIGFISYDTQCCWHYIIMIIIFNYTPIRLMQKAYICALNLLIYIVCSLVKSMSASPLLFGAEPYDRRVVQQAGLLLLFFCFQGLLAWKREESMVENHIAIKFGEVQSSLLNKRKLLNDMLLNSMLPEEITRQMDGEGDDHASKQLAFVESFPDVTVLFCMIDNFSEISKHFNADEIIKILNIIYVEFDEICDQTNIYKVETVGEVYMMVAGCPNRSVNHAVKAAKTSLQMLQAMPMIREKLINSVCGPEATYSEDPALSKKMEMFSKIDIKVGLNSGAVTAGVIGETCQRFKLFGDTVNTASRMETNSEPGKITCSQSTFTSIVKIDASRFKFRKRPLLNIKGKGLMPTYFLVGSSGDSITDFDKDLAENYVRSNIFMVRLKNSSSSSPEHIKLLQAIDQMEEPVLSQELKPRTNVRTNSPFEYGDSSEASSRHSMINSDGASTIDNRDKENIANYIEEERARKSRSGIFYLLKNHVSSKLSSIDHKLHDDYHRELSKKLTNRNKPQLPMSQTLLLIVGPYFPKFKLTEKEAGFETLYLYNNFVRWVRIVRLFLFFWVGQNLVQLMSVIYYFYYSSSSNGKLDGTLLALQFTPQIVVSMAYIAVSTLKSFYLYHENFLVFVWFVIGLNNVARQTYRTVAPNYAMILIIIMMIFSFETIPFFLRIGLSLLLTIVFFMFSNIYCVTYMDRKVLGEESSFNFDFNITKIARKFCGLEELAYGSFLDEMHRPPSPRDTELDYDGEKLLNYMHGSIKDTGFETLLRVQTKTIKDSTVDFIMILVFVLLLTYPTWISSYFQKVCFNRVITHEERELEMLKASKTTQDHLNKLLPGSIVQILQKNPGQSIAEKFNSATILFCDMVGFTKFSGQLDPDELVLFLNHLYSKFDTVLNKYSLYKVEIIGDALFAVAGCPQELHDDFHAARAVCAAHAILEEVKEVSKDLEIPVKVRIGVHTGDVVAGVVGVKDPRYHLFGETVNTAEMIESTGSAGKVHVSEAAMQSVIGCGRSDIFNSIEFEERAISNLPVELVGERREKAEDNINKGKEVAGKTYFSSITVPLNQLSFVKLQMMNNSPEEKNSTGAARQRRRTLGDM